MMMGSTNVLLVMFIIAFSHLHFPFAASSNSSCTEIEWKALMDFKGSLIDSGNRLSSWSRRDCCSWDGITCHSQTGFVQMIHLSSHYKLNILGGHINSSLLNLEHLEYLDLGYNDFSGTPIPAFLGSLGNLRYLNMYMTGFSGEIPQHLGNLSNLQHLSLGEDGFETTGSYSLSSNSLNWITKLNSLKSLELSSTNLSESLDWLDSINRLSSLSSLTLDNCGLVGMASSRDLNLTSLIWVHLSRNNLNSVLPPSLFNLSSLENIRISNSSLRGPIPDMFQKLTALTYLDLSYNSFRSSLPDSLCTLSGHADLDLSVSQLQGFIPSCLGNMTNLASLGLGSNELSGSIPSELGFLTQLLMLNLRDNQLSGRIPSTLGELNRLILFDISKNYLMGELSESFFVGLQSLEYLFISKNHLIVLNLTSQWIHPVQFKFIDMESVFIGSPFPAWIQTQTNLIQLSLINTSISGVIPDLCQTSCPNLIYFDVSNNFLTGPIPTFNGDMNSTLDYLILSDNRLTGSIPDALCNLRSLSILKLANNNLTGRIPSCLGNLQMLVLLDLANNSFSGHIPNELGCLSMMYFLHLNGNKLSGELPSSLKNLTELRTLDLSRNELQGSIPNWIGNKFLFLEHMMLQSNNFSGGIPLDICQLQILQILDLGDNNLVGTIPSCLGNLSYMLTDEPTQLFYADTILTIIKGVELEFSSNLKYAKFISLSGNHLHSEIPDELMELRGLQSLNLSSNELTGKIPESIGNMKFLESLDLSMNQLSGTIPQSLTDIDALGYLRLSFNKLAGRIPFGDHFDTLNDPSVYEGNGELCGKPTIKSCADDLVDSKQNELVSDGDDEFEIDWIYAGIGPGFAIGFLGFFCFLYFYSSWRYVYFRFLEKLYNRF